MNQLKKIIIKTIEETGPLPVSAYMETCLFHPEFGYYSSKDPIGKQGDFITSPEISQIFGELIGVWLVNTWKSLGRPKSFNLVELGPGKGTLIQDIFRSTNIWPEFQEAANLYLYEKSYILTEIQKCTLKGIPINWIDSLESIPRRPIICIANEFFDALPVRQFVVKNQILFEKKVSVSIDKDIQFELFESHENFKFVPNEYDQKENIVFERSELQIETLRYLCERLQDTQGCLLIIDYGSEYGQVDTLQGMYKNKYCDFLEKPGQVDLTSHVDFGLLSDYAKSFGTKPAKLISQRVFLFQMGILERFKKLVKFLSGTEKDYQAQAVNRLVSKHQMGDLMKVLAIRSNGGPDIYPFLF